MTPKEITDEEARWFQVGLKMKEQVIPIIGKENVHKFADWLDSDWTDRRLIRAICDPEEAARAWKHLRYEDWR